MGIETLLSALGVGGRLHARLSAVRKEATGHSKSILRELEHNVDLINLWRKSEFDIDKVIGKLETGRFESADAAHFDLNDIRDAKVKESTASKIPQYQKYVGWTTEKLLASIYRKIKVLKHAVEIDRKNEKIDKKARLTNIYKLIILFTMHVAG